jgi:hypothetical protein
MSAGRNTAPNVLAFNTCAQHTGWNQDGDVARSRVCLSHIPGLAVAPIFHFDVHVVPSDGIQCGCGIDRRSV